MGRACEQARNIPGANPAIANAEDRRFVRIPDKYSRTRPDKDRLWRGRRRIRFDGWARGASLDKRLLAGGLLAINVRLH